MTGERIAYGADPDQFGEWWMPTGNRDPIATALLLHGGYYRSPYTLDLMRPLAEDLASRGFSVWNVEYRRPDAHGWSATVADVRAAHVALAVIPSFAADAPLIVVGHSAGGQLALQLAESAEAPGADTRTDTPPIALAVSLAGVVDLPGAFARNSSNGAVRMALGGSPIEQPERYAAASPSLFPARRTPWLLVQGTDDDDDFVLPNRDLAANARLGHPELLEAPGDHFAVIDPAAPIWHATLARVAELLAEPPGAARFP